MDGATLNIADRDGTNTRKVGDLPGLSYSPAVSPDGNEIRVTVVQGEDSTSLWEVGSDGNGARRLTFGGKDLYGASCGRWTPETVATSFFRPAS